MSDRKHEHVEPRDIAGADLPSYVGNRSAFRGLWFATPPAIVLWVALIAAGWQLWVYRASIQPFMLATFGWSLWAA